MIDKFYELCRDYAIVANSLEELRNSLYYYVILEASIVDILADLTGGWTFKCVPSLDGKSFCITLYDGDEIMGVYSYGIDELAGISECE